jgi:hypothetical protein
MKLLIEKIKYLMREIFSYQEIKDDEFGYPCGLRKRRIYLEKEID